MKKTFRSILAGALALLAVSCYDDSGLRDDLKKLDERVTALETTLNAEVESVNDLAGKLTAAQAAIAKLEETVATQGTDIASLKTSVGSILPRLDAVDGATDGKIANLEAAIAALQSADQAFDTELAEAIAKIAVTKVEEKDGNVVLTLATGDEVVLSKPLSNVNNNGLVTIVEDADGVRHWAVVGADGTPEMLPFVVGAAGTIEFKIEENELMFTLNGEDWESTGAYVADSSFSLLTDFYQNEYFDEDLWKWVTDDFYTLEFGGTEYQIPLYKVDNSVVAIKSGKTYFSYGDTKVVDVVLTDISTMYVMTKPDGWRAKLADKKLTVTAPAEANVLSGVAEADGEILIHCTTTEGKCKIASLTVATTPGFSLTLSDDGALRIVNPEVVTQTDRWGNELTDFNDACIGLAPVAAFEANPVEYVKNIQDNYDDQWIYINNWKTNSAEYDEESEMMIYAIGGAYTPGTYEVDVIETTVADMYADWNYGEEIPATPFVVWACPMDESGMPRINDLVYAYYYPSVKATITASAATTSDVELSVNVVGADHYYVGFATEEMMYGLPVDSYMQNQEGPFGYFQMALQYGMPDYAFQQMGTEFGGLTGAEMPEVLTASMLNGGSPFMPNTKIYVWVFPVIDGLELADYTYEKNLKPYIYSFETTGLQPGGSLTVDFGAEDLRLTYMSVELAAEGASMIYYNYFTPEDYNAFENDAEITETLLELGNVLAGSSLAVNSENKVTPGSEFYLVALAVDAEGKYGEITSKLCAAPEITFSETFKATFGETKSAVYYSGYKYDFPITVEGGEAAKYYYVWSTTEYTDEQLANLPLVYDYDYNFRSTTNVAAGQLAGQYANASSTYYLAVVVESTTGALSKPIKMTVEVPAVPAE